MSSTSQATAKQRGTTGHVWRMGLFALIAALIVNTLISLIAKALFPVAPTFTPLVPGAFILFTILGVLAATIVFAQIARRANNPVQTFQRTVWIVLVVSLIPDLLVAFLHVYPGTTYPEVGALMLMHIATAMICFVLLPRAK